MTSEMSRSRIDLRRDRVSAAARDLFTRYGFHSTGIAQIADASGIAVQQIYRDFANKEGIVAAIVEEDVRTLFAEISQISSLPVRGRGALREWVRQMLSRVVSDDHPPLFLEIFAEASRNPRIAAILQEIDVHARAGLVEAFAGFAAPGAEPGHLSAVADLFLTIVGGLSQRGVANPAFERDRLTDLLAELIVGQIARETA